MLHLDTFINNAIRNSCVRMSDMKKYTEPEFREMVAHLILNGELEAMTDKDGQLIFCTGLYENSDGEIQDEHDPTFGTPLEITYETSSNTT